jgi:hypothetical protein
MLAIIMIESIISAKLLFMFNVFLRLDFEFYKMVETITLSVGNYCFFTLK